MDQDFSDITINDTTDRKNILKIVFDIFFYIIILFAIFSIIITFININKISNHENGYLIHNIEIKSIDDPKITTYHYLLYKVVKVSTKTTTNVYFRFWFMEDIDY